jgi:hypothetical protein
MTVRDLIKSSLRIIGAIASGETPSADEASDALQTLNGILGSWSNQSLLVPSKAREVFTLVAGTQVYTIGMLGTFNTTRPIKVLSAAVISAGQDFETPLRLLNQQQWSDVLTKSLSGSPVAIYPEGTYPLDTINVYPVPQAADQLIIYSMKPLTSFASINDEIELPVGYDRALKYNLAVELAPEYGKQLPQEVFAIASQSKSEIEALNSESVYLTSDALFINKANFNILTGV